MEGNISNLTNTSSLSVTEAEYKYFMKNIYTFIYLLIIAVIGTFGNAHVIIVYWIHYKSSRHRVFITFLAAVDIIPCALLVPYTIAFSIVRRFSFQNDASCKIDVFLTQALGFSSIGILTLFSLERYYTICRAKTKYCSLFQIKVLCFVTIGCASLMCCPNLVYFGNDYAIQDPKEMFWKMCTILKPYRNTDTFKMFFKVGLGVSLLLFLISAIAYARLGGYLRTHRRLPAFVNRLSLGSRRTRNSTYDKSTRTILTYFVATLLSFMLYLAVHFLVFFLTVLNGATIIRTLGSFYGICLRLNFASHAVNPIVYGFMDNKFRQRCRLIYKCPHRNVGDRRASTIQMINK
ncbi:hypothetical protein KUTeg_021144 [Tegillarca granosa]|uniref:G-protein coupled receptors family 1 profile domain-containing protein n=1 Tax=Tegillarca granosa TaxID=220873 RepID=A0ABQ9EF27_TEGGR|nr:hypothetical protein KUTeg_021144 [Tegillarca granosa]